jgi:1-acyl-sn-glycerol-3-phosphate acyltransferase
VSDPHKDPGIRDSLVALSQAMREGIGAHARHPMSLPDHGHDPTFLDRLGPLLDFLYTRYFRVRTLGMEHVPLEGPALLVANHSGGLPYDGAMLLWGVHRLHPHKRRVRPLVANFAFRVPWMMNVIARIGGVRAAAANALPLLASGELVAVFPEGLKGIGKPFKDRYQLVRFGRGGFIRLAMDAGVPIVPVAIVGAEEIHPVIGKLTRLAQPLGLPYIPVTPTFPWLGPLGLLPVPTKWTIQFGPAISLPSPPADDEERAALAAKETERVKRTIDDMLVRLLVDRRSVLFG